MTTDENGEYLFTGVPDGTYTIVVTDENGVLANTVQTGDPDAVLDNQSDVSLDPGGTNPTPVVNLDQDFGYQPALGAIRRYRLGEPERQHDLKIQANLASAA